MTRNRLALLLLSALLCAPAARAAVAEADSLWNAGEREAAFAVVAADRDRAEAAADTTAWIASLTTEGRFFKVDDRPAEAETSLRAALALAEAAGDSSLACAPLRWLGVALTNMGRNEEALAEYRRLVTLAAAVGDTVHEAWANVGLGWDDDLRRDHQAAHDHYGRAAALFESAGDGEGALWAHLGVANSRFHLGDYEGAGAGWSRVAGIARDEGFARHEAITRNNIAGLQFALGRPDVSLREYALAVAVWDSLGQAFERMPPALNHAGCLAILGRVDEARTALRRELATCREAGFTDYEARALRKLADLERDQGDADAAERLYAEALALGEERPVLERVEVLMGLASLHTGRGDDAAALATLDRAETLLAGDLTSQIRLRVDLRRAAALLRLGRPDAAAPLLERTDANLGGARARYGMDLELLRATLHESRGEADAALAALEAAAELWERERSLPLDPDWREERGAAGRALFSRLGAALLRRDGAEAAFDRLQDAKARTLRERLAGPGIALADSVAPPPDAAALRTSILEPGTVLLDAYLGADGGLFFALTPDTCLAAPLPPADALSDSLLAWRDLLADPAAPAAARAGLERSLRADLFDGLAPALAGARSVILVPDGPLNLAPLSLLLDGEAAWTSVPSTGVLRDLRTHDASDPAPGLLVITSDAAELTGAAWQAQRLSERLADVTVLRCPDPDPVPDAAALADRGAIHVAAHVRPDDVNAWQSAVLLGPDDGQELRAVDVAAMDLDARLVVLASCGSATGRVLSGEGVQGLAASFTAAGAHAVVASLWPVDDTQTAVLMDRFYDGLAGGATVSDALAAAREALRSDPATAHPFAWAGFVVIGDGATRVPVEPARPRSWYWFAALPAVVAGLAAAARRRRGGKA